MPQYLGIDYLQHALEKTCAFLSFALLPVPDHLDKVENYPHKGLPSEHDIRQFQKKGIAFNELYHETDISLHDSFKLLCDKISVIPLDAFSSESLEFEEFEEVVFSSYNTPDSGELIYIQPSSSENMLQSEDIEIFCKGDFQEIRKEIDRDHQWYLEDVYCSSLFKECLQKLPTLKTYVKRLSLMKIADPLLCRDGTLLSENKLFQMNFSSSIKTEFFTETKELFLPITDLHLDIEKSQYFEEVMTPTYHFDFTMTQLNIQQLTDLLQLQEFNIKLDERGINTILAEHCVKHLSSEFQETLSQSVDNENDAYSFIEKETTSEMNQLETPLTSPVKEDLPKPNLIHLLDVVPFNMNDDMNHILSPKSVNKINIKFWQEEKFCDEVSTLRLPEPFIEAHPFVQNYVKTILECMKFSPENISSKVDLALNWDPFQDFTIIRNHLEILNSDSQIPVYQNFDHVFVKNLEIIEVTSQDQTLDQVELHKAIQWSSNSSHKEKEQLISQKVISPSNDVNLGLNPLDDFFLMRFGSKNSKITADKETTKRNEEKAKKDDLTLHNDYKFIENILHVAITDELNVLLQEISNSAEPFIRLLQISGDLTPDKLFQDLQPDIIGFLLNQKQKSLQDAGKKDCINEELEAMIAVHILVSTADVLLNCCFESAIIHLSEMIENDSSIQGCFENLRNTFFKARNNFHQQNITHPKIVSIAKEIEKWQLQNKIKSNFNGKILIITQRNIPGLMTAILDHILLGTKTKAEIVDSNCSKNIHERLSTLNSSVILMKETLITKDFPWFLFSFIIQYEHNKKASDYLRLCEAQGITFCSMQLIINTNAKLNPSICKSNSMRIYIEVIKLIGSEAITHNKQLLQLLETRYNIVIIGRMFHQLSAAKRLYFADIIIDERNSIVLCSPSQLQEDMLEPFIFRLFSLSIKFSFCYIIITQTTANANCDQITDISCNLSKLMGTLAILSNYSQCSYKILLSYEMNETAVFIREISEHCLETSTVWSHQKWLERDWLSEDITKGEKFLINWPCLNSFCAQLMLKSTSLKQLLLLPIEHLKHRFHWLPHQVIELFHQITNKDGGLQLRVTNIPTISFPSQLSSENKEVYPYEPLEFQPLTNKKLSFLEDLPLVKEETNKTMPHFKCQKKFAESPNSCLNNNSEFLLEIPDLEFYPAPSKEKRFSNKNNCSAVKKYSSNNFGFDRKENLHKLFLDSDNLDEITERNSHHDIHLDYNLGTQNVYYPSNNRFDISSSNELNFASLNDDPIRITDHLSQQKTKLSQEREMFLVSKERRKSTKGDESETALNSWSQFFEDFKVGNRNKKTMAVSPSSSELTTPSFQTNYFHIDSTAKKRSTLDYLVSQRASNPIMSSTPEFLSPSSKEFLSSQKGLSYSTEKLYKKPKQAKNFLFSQFSNRTKTGDFHLPQNYTSSYSSSDINNRPGKTNKIFPDKFGVREVEYPHHIRKRVSIGLAQPLMRNSQETGLMASQPACSSVTNHGSETELNTNEFSAKSQALKSPESAAQFFPSSQFYSGSTPQIFTFGNNKKRRLTFEKVPGQKDGQTKLLFS